MLDLITTRVWALETKYYHHAVAVISARLAQGLPALDAADAHERRSAMADRLETRFYAATFSDENGAGSKKIAVVKLIGAMQKRGGMCSKGTEEVSAELQRLYGDASVSAIVLEVDSPGGDVDGTEALGNVVRGSNKPVVAWVNGMAASAGYWVASQASHIMLSSKTSAYVGSIGVLAMHVDQSAWLEKEGIKATILRSTKATDKARFNSVEPLSDELRSEYVGHLDKLHEAFIATVRAGRQNDKRKLDNSLFTGKMYDGAEAIANGLADSVGTREDAIRRAAWLSGRSKSSNSSNQAHMKFPKLSALFGQVTEPTADAEVTEIQAQSAEATLAQQETQITELQGQVSTLTTERGTLQARVAELEGQVTDLQAGNATLIQANQTLTAQNAQLAEQNTTLENWRKESKARNGKQEDELNALGGDTKPKADYEIEAEEKRAKAHARHQK